MATQFKYKNVQDFQNKHKTKEEREAVLKTLSNAEIRHLASTCGTKQGGAYYMRHIKGAQ